MSYPKSDNRSSGQAEEKVTRYLPRAADQEPQKLDHRRGHFHTNGKWAGKVSWACEHGKHQRCYKMDCGCPCHKAEQG